MKDPPPGPPQHPAEKTITLTLTTPGQAAQHHHSQGPSGGGIGTPLIVSGTSLIPSSGGLGGLAAVSAAPSGFQHGTHGAVSVHYAGPAISASALQSKLPQGQNFVLGPGGPPLIVSAVPSGASTIGGLGAASGTAGHATMIPHYGAPSLGSTGLQSNLQPKAPTTQSYVVSAASMNASNVCGPDSGDEGVPVSIRVTNTPMSAPGGPGDADGSQGQTEQRLKVEDALNYLDQVKYKFGNQPQVYNDFLDIMKEFKSQSIDTPGVISRVSHLFRGHPELITGFNTFLPPGYKIEVQMNDQLPLGSVSSGVNYKVTTVHTTGFGPSQQSQITTIQHSGSQVIQHSAPSIPVRSTVVHPSHPGPAASPYGGSGTGTSVPPVTVSSVSITSLGQPLSPVRPPSLPSSGSNVDAAGGGGSAFTHSLASPFVQNAFPTLQSQPVEFNHAINYVNKIKNRFHQFPDKYKQFLEILHTYQKEQRNTKDGLPSKHLTEHEVYHQVAKLFENQEDLLQEFSQFLPDATGVAPPPLPTATPTSRQNIPTTKEVKRSGEDGKKPAKQRPDHAPPTSLATQPSAKPVAPTSTKRTLLNPTGASSVKKVKYQPSFKDISLAEAGKYGNLNDFAFFDKVRSLLRSQEAYDNFLRILQLFNEEIIARAEVVQLAQPFLTKAPELLAWFKDFLARKDQSTAQQFDPVPSVSKQEKLTQEQVLEIDFSTCKRLGASYCALPKNHIPPKCSGRTLLCKEVLNDVWVSFPTWSEDSTFVTSRKTQFEEYIYRCEDERFELDVVIETNTETIRCLEAVMKRIGQMNPQEVHNFQLDDCLGGSSPTIHQRAIRRIYGERATDIIASMKKIPSITVPIVIKRLRSKDDEWREAQKGFNKIWREQVERFYLKSLDHQGITFKQGDIRALRSKALITEIETIYDERLEQNAVDSVQSSQAIEGPHLVLQYRDRSVLDDACNLLLHHVRRQSGIQKEDKRKIKQILKHFVNDLFNHPRIDLSDDENDDGSQDENDSTGSKNSSKRSGTVKRSNGNKTKRDDELEATNEQGSSSEVAAPIVAKGQESRRTIAKRELKLSQSLGGKKSKDKVGKSTIDDSVLDDMYIAHIDPNKFVVTHQDDDENYRLFFINNSWYVFLRLHQILCERLTKLLETAVNLAMSEPKESRDPETSAAIMLRLKPKPDMEIEEYYPTFLEMVRSLLDGNVEPTAYEDQLREMFGIHAYVAYTMDKVVANAVRQLQNLVTDETCQKSLELFHEASRRGGTGGSIPTASQRVRSEISYQRKAEKAFGEENCVKVVIYEKHCEMTMELLECETPSSPGADDRPTWFSYVDKYMTSEGIESEEVKSDLMKRPLFLKRNRRKPLATKEIKKDKDEKQSVADEDAEANVTIKDEAPEEGEIVQPGGSGLHCHFDPSSYKMVYVIDGEDAMYRKQALKRAHETHQGVSQRMLQNFDKWHEDWLLKNTTRKDRSDCEAWLKDGPKLDVDMRSKKTVKVVTKENKDKPPYRLYKRYLINKDVSDKH